MNWQDWVVKTECAPHGKAFYVCILVLGLLGASCSVALSQNGDASMGWRIAFAIPGVCFVVGMGQAVERLGWPERAGARSAGLTELVRSRMMLTRFIALAVSLGGCALASVATIFTNAETQDFYDNFRIVCFLLIFVCFCLADFAGDETFPSSMWPTAWRAVAVGIGRKPKRRRRRRSLY